jgi:hypothetical protein
MRQDFQSGVPHFVLSQVPKREGVKDVPEQCVKDVMELNSEGPGEHGIVLSHPFRKGREKDGASRFCACPE